MELKIVGSIPDENYLDEIQSIAKIVIYEQRMKNFNIPISNNKSKQKTNCKNNQHHIIPKCTLKQIMVRGLI